MRSSSEARRISDALSISSKNSDDSEMSSVRQINLNTLRLGFPIPRSNWLTSAVLIPEISENSLMVKFLSFLY